MRSAHPGGHAVRAPDHPEAHVALHELGQLALDGALEQGHQGGHFLVGPVPVLRGERVEGEEPDPELARGAHDRPHRLHALAVPGHARKPAVGGPPPVAVHDDRDVAWDRPGEDALPEIVLVERRQL